MSNHRDWQHQVKYCSIAAYSPRGKNELSERSREICYGIKGNQNGWIEASCHRLSLAITEEHRFGEFFDDETTLVPVPRSNPLLSDTLWPSLIIACQIYEQNLGKTVEPLIERVREIPKSAAARPGERPSYKHQVNSLTCKTRGELTPRRFLLVDDVVTKGTTLAACAAILRNAYPQSLIRCYAIIRTVKKHAAELEKIRDPVEGTIKLSRYGTVFRSP